MKSLIDTRLVSPVFLVHLSKSQFKLIFYFIIRNLLTYCSKTSNFNAIKIQICFFHPEVKAKVIEFV